MTKDELKLLYEEWEESKLADKSDMAASDDYYYAGASSFRDFLEKRLTVLRKT